MTHTDPRPLPFAVFDEFGKPADDRVQDHIYAALSEVLGDSQPTPPSWMDREPVAKIKPSQKSMRELLSEAALGDSQPVALTVVDIADDDALRFACRCLGAGSYPPGEDRETARNGLMAIRTRLRASPRRAEPASVQALTEALEAAREALDTAIATVNFAVSGWVHGANPQKIDRELRDAYNKVHAAITKTAGGTA